MNLWRWLFLSMRSVADGDYLVWDDGWWWTSQLILWPDDDDWGDDDTA